MWRTRRISLRDPFLWPRLTSNVALLFLIVLFNVVSLGALRIQVFAKPVFLSDDKPLRPLEGCRESRTSQDQAMVILGLHIGRTPRGDRRGSLPLCRQRPRYLFLVFGRRCKRCCSDG